MGLGSLEPSHSGFETYVDEILLSKGGWKSGRNASGTNERALFRAQVFAFLQETHRWLLPLSSKRKQNS